MPSSYSRPGRPCGIRGCWLLPRRMPRWLPAAAPPQDPAGYLILLPDCCESSLPEDWLTEAEAAGACVLRNLHSRDEMLAAAFERLDHGHAATMRSGLGGRFPRPGVLPFPGRDC